MPFITAGAAYWLAVRKFKKEHLWQEKYSAYQEILCATEVMECGIDEEKNKAMMLPTIRLFDGKKSLEFCMQARRQIAKQVSIGKLLISDDAVEKLKHFQDEISLEYFRLENESSTVPDDEEDEEREWGLHFQKLKNIIEKYLPEFIKLARKDLAT